MRTKTPLERHQTRRDKARKAWLAARSEASALCNVVAATGTHLDREEATRLLAAAEANLAELLRLSDRTNDAMLREDLAFNP